MILSDTDIWKAIQEGRLVIDPCPKEAIQPVSVDLTLGSKLRVFHPSGFPMIDVKQPQPNLTRLIELDDVAPFILHPSDFALGITAERVELPDHLMGRLDGKSSLGRLGLLVHSTAGFIDPGFKGRVVLEFSNVSPLPITLYVGMPIAQISFYRLSRPATRPYGHHTRASKYQDQDGPTPSRYYLNFKDTRERSTASHRKRSYRASPTALKEWLDESCFKGSVTQFARALGIPMKTVEDWVYGRHNPGREHMGRLYELTQLPDYAFVQTKLPAIDDD